MKYEVIHFYKQFCGGLLNDTKMYEHLQLYLLVAC
jgi:hypothetical protein